MDFRHLVQGLDHRIRGSRNVDAKGGLDEFGRALVETVEPFRSRAAALRVVEIIAVSFGDVGEIGFHPSLLFAGVGGTSFETLAKLFGVDACEAGVEGQTCLQIAGNAGL